MPNIKWMRVIFFSVPYSIFTAFGLAYSGAHGQTSAEMSRALHLPRSPVEIGPAFSALSSTLNEEAYGDSTTIANSLWVQRGFNLSPSFIQLAKHDFNADLQLEDFTRDTSIACRDVNRWVAQATNGRITNIMSPEKLSAVMRLVLCNAIYFRDRWAHPFPLAATSQAPFHLASGQEVLVSMMHVEGSYPMIHFDDFTLFEMGYQRGCSMVALLPDAVDGLSKLESKVSVSSLSGWLNAPTTEPWWKAIRVSFPRFSFSETMTFPDLPMTKQMPDVFDQKSADFAGISESGGIWISELLHKAWIKVDEEGTEAAAVTTLEFNGAGLPRPSDRVFVADHPFLFVIRNDRTGLILFMGRVLNPNSNTCGTP